MQLIVLLLSLLSTTPDVPVITEPTVIFVSNDQGKTWNDFGKGLPDDVQTRNVLEHNGKIYLSTSVYGVFILPEGTNTWEHSSAGLPISKEGFFPTAMAAHGNYIVLGTYMDGLYVSRNGGANWRKSRFGIPNVVIQSLLFTDEWLLAGTDNGIWQSFDGGDSWQRYSDDYTPVNALAMHNGELFVAKQNGMGVMKDKEVVWADKKTQTAIIQLLIKDEYIYTVTVSNEVFRSKDGCFWEAPLFAVKGLPSNNLPEALWGGFKPKVSSELPAGLVTETSRGWVVGVGTGC